MAPRRSTQKTTKNPLVKKGRSKKEKTPQKEEDGIQEPSSPIAVSAENDENTPPPSKEESSKTGARALRSRAKKTVSYHEDSDTDPCSDDGDESDKELCVKSAPAKKGAKRRAAAGKKKPAAKKQKSVHSSPSVLSVRPPEGNSPRPIVGREVVPSPEDDWRSTECMDW